MRLSDFIKVSSFVRYMLLLCSVLGLFLVGENVCHAETTVLDYKAYKVKSGEIIDHSRAVITPRDPRGYDINWSITNDEYTHSDRYVLDEGWRTLEWHIYLSDREIDYRGFREGKTLYLSGVFEGKRFEKEIKLRKDLPFLYNPKIGLKGFAASDQERIEFWGFRGDNLSEFLMKAEKQGVASVLIDGRSHDALKIYWAATGLGERFFNRVYYYRLSDGEFLTQDPTDGWTMHLMDARDQAAEVIIDAE